MPATLIDPDLGLVALNFKAKPDDAEPDVVLDAYRAVDLLPVAQRVYLKELEAAGRQAEATESEIYRRWAVEVFKPHPEVDVIRLSVGQIRQISRLCFDAVADLKKGEPGSSTPA